jgi:hypothetical protein
MVSGTSYVAHLGHEPYPAMQSILPKRRPLSPMARTKQAVLSHANTFQTRYGPWNNKYGTPAPQNVVWHAINLPKLSGYVGGGGQELGQN